MVLGHQKRFRKHFLPAIKWGGSALLLALASVYGFVRYDFSSSAGDLENQIRRAKTHGIALSPDEMKPNPPVKPEENAAPIYRKLAAILGNVRERRTPPFESEFLRAAEALSIKDVAAVDSYLERYDGAIELVVQASSRPRCDFERDWNVHPNLFLSPLGEMRAVVRVIVASALNEAQRGNWDRFFTLLEAVSKMESHIASEAFLFAGWFSVSVDAQLLLGIETAATLAANDAVKLEKLRTFLGSLPKSTGVKPFLKGEAIKGYLTCRNLKEEYDKESNAKSKSSGQEGNIGSESLFRIFPLPFESDLCERAYSSRLLNEWNDALDAMGNDIKFSSRARAVLVETNQRMMNSKRPSDYLPSYLLPNFVEMDKPFVVAKARRECVQATLDLLLYKKRNGSIPESLSEAGVNRMDPIDGTPLKFVKTPTGFRVYCAEINGKLSDGRFGWESANVERGRELIISSFPSWERYTPGTRMIRQREIRSSASAGSSPPPGQPRRRRIRVS